MGATANPPLCGGKKWHKIRKKIEPPKEPHRPRVRGQAAADPKDRPRSVSRGLLYIRKSAGLLRLKPPPCLFVHFLIQKINYYVQNNILKIPEDYIEYTHEYGNKEYTFKHYIGQNIICRKSFKRKRCDLYTNFIYKILDIDNDEETLTIRNINDNKEMIITYDQLKYISLPYSSTCHSAQGLTIKEPYTIFDTNIAYTDRRWIYTALSRCVSFDQITIFEHSNNECNSLEKCKYNQYFDLKIKNYIQQDIIGSRITKDNDNLYYKGCIINNYIDSNWLKEQKQ